MSGCLNVHTRLFLSMAVGINRVNPSVCGMFLNELNEILRISVSFIFHWGGFLPILEEIKCRISFNCDVFYEIVDSIDLSETKIGVLRESLCKFFKLRLELSAVSTPCCKIHDQEIL